MSDAPRTAHLRHLGDLVSRRILREARKIRYGVYPPKAVQEYLNKAETRKLHIGAGTVVLDGWLNTDRDPPAAYLDATARLPFEDQAFQYVFSEHTIEHLTYGAGLSMLAECHRVLRPGGAIRLATPDLVRMIALYQGGEPEERYLRWSIDTFRGNPDAAMEDADDYRAAFVLNNMFRGWGHKFIYDEETLQAALERVGFVDVKRFPCGQSDLPDLTGLESHGIPEDREMFQFETLVLQARRR